MLSRVLFWKPPLFRVLYDTPGIPGPCVHHSATNTATFSQSAFHLGTVHAFFFDAENEGRGFANTFNTMQVKEVKHLAVALFVAESEVQQAT